MIGSGKDIRTFERSIIGLEKTSRSVSLSQGTPYFYFFAHRWYSYETRTNCNHNKADGFERRLEVNVLNTFYWFSTQLLDSYI